MIVFCPFFGKTNSQLIISTSEELIHRRTTFVCGRREFARVQNCVDELENFMTQESLAMQRGQRTEKEVKVKDK